MQVLQYCHNTRLSSNAKTQQMQAVLNQIALADQQEMDQCFALCTNVG